MINKLSIDAVQKSTFGTHFTKPLYDSYCFSNIPQTIKNVLINQDKKSLPKDVFGDLPQNYDKVIFILVDGFGWRFFEKYYHKIPILNKFSDTSSISKLTSQFPSTTVVHSLCRDTGLQVNQIKPYEWFYYEPLIDEVIAPLPFSFAGDNKNNTLSKTDLKPENIFPDRTIYDEFKENQIQSFHFAKSEIINSPYQNVMYKNVKGIPYNNLEESLEELTHFTVDEKSKSYFSFYYDVVDAISHRYGPESAQVEEEIIYFFRLFENIFLNQVFDKLKKTLLIITADHGHVEIHPKNTFYLNVQIPEIFQYFKTNKKGIPIVPSGSCRDMFLYVQEKHLEELQKLLKNALSDIAEVYKTDDLLKLNFFGINKPSTDFLERVGNLVILPYKNQPVWWYEKNKFGVHTQGFHGGLTPEEMEIPFILYSFN